MHKIFSRTNTILLIAVALTALAFAPLTSQAALVPADANLGALGNGDSASFAETELESPFETAWQFDYVGTGDIYAAGVVTIFPADGPPFIFAVDDFNFTVGTVGTPLWNSFTVAPTLIGRIITKQELADAGITSGTTLEITMSGEPAGLFQSSYSGSVAVVPIPAAAWLLGSGLMGLVALRRRSQR